jgi:hypothetical protein
MLRVVLSYHNVNLNINHLQVGRFFLIAASRGFGGNGQQASRERASASTSRVSTGNNQRDRRMKEVVQGRVGDLVLNLMKLASRNGKTENRRKAWY